MNLSRTVEYALQRSESPASFKSSPTPPPTSPCIVISNCSPYTAFCEDSLTKEDNASYTITPLPYAVDQFSTAYFFTSYIVATPFESYLPKFYATQPIYDDAFSLSVSATALAAFARRTHSPQYEARARRLYAQALHHINPQLQKRETAIKDRTLASVLLLGLFEAIVFPGGQSPTGWTAHCDGAMNILLLRGEEHFNSPVSLQLFEHASNNIRTSCIQRWIAIPPKFLALSRKLSMRLPPTRSTVGVSPLVERIAEVKSECIKNPSFEFLLDAFRLDREIYHFSRSSLHKLLPYTITEAEEGALAYRRIIHKYASPRATKIWNAVRLVRIFLVHFIYSGARGHGAVVIKIPDTNEARAWKIFLEEYAVDNMREISEEILAGMPAFLEERDGKTMFIPSARSLAWPLTIIETDDISPPEAKKFAREVLEKLALDLNIPEVVQEGRDPGSKEDWHHLFHLG